MHKKNKANIQPSWTKHIDLLEIYYMADQCRKSWVDRGANQKTGFASFCPIADWAIVVNKFTFTGIINGGILLNLGCHIFIPVYNQMCKVVEYYN